jgi:hypothetical protein
MPALIYGALDSLTLELVEKLRRQNTTAKQIVPQSTTNNYIVLVMRFRSAVLLVLAALAIAKAFHAQG